jgi:ABC-2 type transport system ATP-binding protein
MSDVMIEAQKLNKYYGSNHALRDVSFEVPGGQVVGFLGPNGAGKTTAMKILTCFIAPTDGTATINGCDIFDDPVGVRRAIGYLPESTPLYTDMLTLEYLQFVAKMRGFRGDEAHKRIKKAVEQTGLGDVIGKEIRALSKGFRQRVGLAQALVHEPPILILDEPLSGLDPNQAVGVRDLIKDIGKERTVILSTHNLAEVQVTCDRVLIVAKGQMVADDTAEGLKTRAGKARFTGQVLRQTNGKEIEPAQIREQLDKISGVDHVQVHEPGGAELSFEVIPKGNEDLRPEIFRAAVDGGLVLIGLQQKGENLEEVFHELTAGRAADAGAPEQDQPGPSAGDDSGGGSSGGSGKQDSASSSEKAASA